MLYKYFFFLLFFKQNFFCNFKASRPDTASPQPQQVLTKRRIQELLREIDPQEQMDEDVEDVSPVDLF